MQFRNIPQFIDCGYSVDIPIADLPDTIDRYKREKPFLTLDPDFQRAHVWTVEQKARYVEFLLRGGKSSRDLYFNCTGWMRDWRGPFEIVDGKQRLDACLSFLDNQFRIFPELDDPDLDGGHGFFYRDFGRKIPMSNSLKLHINALPTRAAVLQWYLDLNRGGVVHTPQELDRVQELLRIERNR